MHFHNAMDASLHPAAIHCPSGDQLIEFTKLKCPPSLCVRLPLSK